MHTETETCLRDLVQLRNLGAQLSARQHPMHDIGPVNHLRSWSGSQCSKSRPWYFIRAILGFVADWFVAFRIEGRLSRS
jgi:hypothetical protein